MGRKSADERIRVGAAGPRRGPTMLMASMTILLASGLPGDLSGQVFASSQNPVSTWAASRTCEAGGEPRVGLGVGTFHCRGGSCLVGGIWATQRGLAEESRRIVESEPGAWDFSVEPGLWEIQADGPLAGIAREGDALVAVNGAPVTTREAGRVLSGMRTDRPVRVTLRRGPRLVDAEVVPQERCDGFRVSSGPGEMPGYLERGPDGRVVRSDGVDRSLAAIPSASTTVRFAGAGLVMAGPAEMTVDAEGPSGLRFTGEAVVAEVVEGGAAQEAGIVPGEVVVSAEDRELTTVEGVAALGAAGPGEPVLLFVRRGNSGRQVVIHER
ncbi:MAG TPA: PDZ domain-containing protein [Longimicrobiales bacterium]|nr:PDZ domain-containing protein [Longimicrobiales bacterium]